jgi:hypothetical protein
MSDISIPAGAPGSSCGRMQSVCAEFHGPTSPGDRTGERLTLPSSGRAMREFDHVAHPQTSGEWLAPQIRGVPWIAQSPRIR